MYSALSRYLKQIILIISDMLLFVVPTLAPCRFLPQSDRDVQSHWHSGSEIRTELVRNLYNMA